MTTPQLTPTSIRDMIAVVDGKLKAVKGRHLFDQGEVADLLLDVRNVLEQLTSPAALVYLAKTSLDEARAIRQGVLGEADPR